MTVRRACVLLVAATALLAGCGAQAQDASHPVATSTARPEGTHTMADGSVMKDSDMQGDMKGMASPGASATPSAGTSAKPSAGTYEDGMSKDYSKEDVNGDGVIGTSGVDGQPSETATMVCADQIEQTVRRTFNLHTTPVGRPSWDGKTFTCTYTIGGAPLVASVRDDSADTATTGRGYFDILRRQLPGTKGFKGIIGLGFPSYQSPAGHVVFLKDHKTLHVDASALPASVLPRGFTREDVAYAVASAVMVCWSA